MDQATAAPLARAVERLAPAMERAAIGMAVTDPNGRYVRVNEAMSSILGRPASDLCALRWQDVVHPADVTPREAFVSAALAGGQPTFECELRYLRPDGTTIWAALQASRIDEGGAPVGFFVQVTDITQHRLAEEVLRHEAALAALVRRVGHAANRAKTIEQAIRATVDLVCEHTGWPIGHVYLATAERDRFIPSDVWHLDSAVSTEEFVRLTRRTTFAWGVGIPGRVGARRRPVWIPDVRSDPGFIRRTGDDIRAALGVPVEVDGAVLAVLEFFSDDPSAPDARLIDMLEQIGAILGLFMERMEREEHLRQREQRLQFILDQVPALIWTTDREMKIGSVEGAGLARFAPDSGPLVGRDVTALLGAHDPDSPAVAATLAALEGEPASYELEIGGEQYQTLIGPLRAPTGEIVGTIGAALNVSDRVAAERALRESERRFAQAYEREREASDRLRALDDMKNAFLAAVSHELRTPLTSVLGFSHILRTSAESLQEAERAHFLERIVANGEKLKQLLEDLLDLDRMTRGVLEPRRRMADVADIARRTVRGWREASDNQVQVEGAPVIATVDAAKVERIIENLLSNAAKHTPVNTPIAVRVEAVGADVIITVDDAGPGVPDHVKASIFHPFTRAIDPTAATPGTGIGLTLVARFAELHGGHAWVEDVPGGGARFRVSLPGAVVPDARPAHAV